MVQEVRERRKVGRQLEQWVKKLKCSGSSGIGLETFKEIRVGVDPSPVDLGRHQSFDPVDNEDLKEVVGDDITTDGDITVDLSDEVRVRGRFRNGLREGQCEVRLSEGEVESIKGEYREGRLAGRARVVFSSGQTIDGYFKAGLLHGFARYFDQKGRLTFAGNHRSGVAEGTCWQIVRGGGSVVGLVDHEGHLTGEHITYLYPDYTTALHGTFSRGVMVSARECLVERLLEEESGVLVPVLGEKSSTSHVRQSRADTDFGLLPTLRDPYEAKMVEIRGSGIDGANEGLFALQDIEMNTVIAFYNGCKANLEDYDPDTWETNNYKIFDPDDIPDGTIDIPVWAQSSSAYCATLAHKGGLLERK